MSGQPEVGETTVCSLYPQPSVQFHRRNIGERPQRYPEGNTSAIKRKKPMYMCTYGEKITNTNDRKREEELAQECDHREREQKEREDRKNSPSILEVTKGHYPG